MSAGNAPRPIQPKLNPRFLPAIDKVLITGIRLGPEGKHQAINRVLQLVPEWKRGDCWRRIRQLRRSSLKTHSNLQPTRPQIERSEQTLSVSRHSIRLWSAEEDAKLLDWAGYEPVKKIAQRLGRSVRAVRFRLGALGMSARVSDGWSQRELRKLLRVSPAKLRHFIGTGMLRVRDPRVTKTSMLALCNNEGREHSALDKLSATLSKADACPWERAAELFGISVEQVQMHIAKGKLRVFDPFVTDRAFEEFCRKHGDQINMSLIDPPTARWLEEEYGVLNLVSPAISRAQKHALVVRTCKCGRKIAGNIYFRHVKHCPVMQNETAEIRHLITSTEVAINEVIEREPYRLELAHQTRRTYTLARTG